MTTRCPTLDQLKELCRLFKNIQFFKTREIVNEQELLEIALSLHLEEFKGGEMLFDEGEPGFKFYIILKGSVAVSKKIKFEVPDDVRDERRKVFQETKVQIADTKDEIKQLYKDLLKTLQMLQPSEIIEVLKDRSIHNSAHKKKFFEIFYRAAITCSHDAGFQKKQVVNPDLDKKSTLRLRVLYHQNAKIENTDDLMSKSNGSDGVSMTSDLEESSLESSQGIEDCAVDDKI